MAKSFFAVCVYPKDCDVSLVEKNMYMSEWIYVYRHSAICIYMQLFMILDPNLTIKVRLNWQKKG